VLARETKVGDWTIEKRTQDTQCNASRSYKDPNDQGREYGIVLTYSDKEIVIIHLGDHDPSGLDMTRDIESRLFMFIGAHLADERDQDSIRRSEVPLEVRRLALNMDQVEEHQPPPNPAKLTDSRAQSYISEWGDESWELDALDVATLSSLISEAIEPLIDQDRWSEAEQREQEGQDRLRLVASNWQKAVDHIQETSK